MEFRTKGGENSMKQDYPGIDLVLARVALDDTVNGTSVEDPRPA